MKIFKKTLLLVTISLFYTASLSAQLASEQKSSPTVTPSLNTANKVELPSSAANPSIAKDNQGKSAQDTKLSKAVLPSATDNKNINQPAHLNVISQKVVPVLKQGVPSDSPNQLNQNANKILLQNAGQSKALPSGEVSTTGLKPAIPNQGIQLLPSQSPLPSEKTTK